ncbi:hypothetical protein [Natronobeatus ordinarius]|uniref:hypothetical protein n=1 Tax=Natronobeatus ordinarius TaxID=2963433 RepID=UPI0020CB6C15|nr:hypothetical protein [Natronobeatus ordinarius]
MTYRIISKGVYTLKREGVSDFIKGVFRFSMKQIVPNSYRRWYARRKYPLPTDLENYSNPPDPFETLLVKTEDIQHFSGRNFPPYYGNDARLGTVMGGDWDKSGPEDIDPVYESRYKLYRSGAERFTESIFYNSLKDHFQNNTPWEETEWFQHCVDFINAEQLVTKGVSTRSGLKLRCKEIDLLFDKITEEGYRTQAELGNYPVAAKEINVDVGRDGTLLFVNGRNRLAIAKILGIDTLPVGVYVRHRKWMQHREDSVRSTSPHNTSYANHPDLLDIGLDT